MEQDTIAAISTAVSNSGIGIIRISGKDAVAVADRVYRSKGGKKRLADQPTHTIHYGYIVDQGETVDEVLVMLMRGPKSFTAEDTVEVNCHGGVYAMKRVLDVVLKNGARPAEPRRQHGAGVDCSGGWILAAPGYSLYPGGAHAHCAVGRGRGHLQL